MLRIATVAGTPPANVQKQERKRLRKVEMEKNGAAFAAPSRWAHTTFDRGKLFFQTLPNHGRVESFSIVLSARKGLLCASRWAMSIDKVLTTARFFASCGTRSDGVRDAGGGGGAAMRGARKISGASPVARRH